MHHWLVSLPDQAVGKEEAPCCMRSWVNRFMFGNEAKIAKLIKPPSTYAWILPHPDSSFILTN